jgi:hypothetical protein
MLQTPQGPTFRLGDSREPLHEVLDGRRIALQAPPIVCEKTDTLTAIHRGATPLAMVECLASRDYRES